MQQVILALTLFLSSAIFAQTQNENKLNNEMKVTVSVVNALSDNGTIAFAFYDEANFMRIPLFAKSSTIKNGVSTIIFENVLEGEYVIICFHDENSNGKMDFQENGMPLENYGTSNNPLNFGPPQFNDSKFVVKNDNLTLEIKF